MAIKTNTPETVALKLAVEKRFGHPIESRTDFAMLAYDIERTTNSHIAENTLRRLWGRIAAYDTVFIRTLDVMCKYIGHEHWKNFCTFLKKETNSDSDIVKQGMSIKVEDLTPIGELERALFVKETQYKAEATAFLDSAYQTALQRIEKLPYHESAKGAKDFYLKYYNDIYSQLPNEKRPAFNEVLSEQIAKLDSLAEGLPSLLNLPTKELEPIYQEVIQWSE